MSQLSRILDVLQDGKAHSVAEIHRRAGTSRLNSRISDLRKDGYVIRCGTVKGATNSERYTYTLLYSIPRPAGADGSRTDSRDSASSSTLPHGPAVASPQEVAAGPSPFLQLSLDPAGLDAVDEAWMWSVA